MLLATFWQTLEYYDQTLLFYINQRGANALFDAVLPWCRQPNLWAPLYLFLVALAMVNMGKKGWYWLFFAVLTIVISDQISSSIFKPLFARLRPCADPVIMPYIKLRLARCSGAFSFTSSHAANHFAVAAFATLTLRPFTGKGIKWLFAWAALVCYAQLYVGVHYPLDVLGGAAIGLASGAATAYMANKLTQIKPVKT
ncbi:MAG: phosphatase PAP2 family protein [Bacteroidetes bacterium]|nr:MAG: phosphatase PAP2 family protein [Bacteroidota bacterium]